MRGSAEYKRQLVGALVKRATEAALERAEGDSGGQPHLCLTSRKKFPSRSASTASAFACSRTSVFACGISPKDLELTARISDATRPIAAHHGADEWRSGESCTVFAVQADAREITTVEGLEETANFIRSKAFGDCYGLQCGYCTLA